MKPNRFAQLLSQGQVPIGHMLFEFNTRGVAQILDEAGVDFAVIDMEHSAFAIADLANLVAWLKATPVAPFVRIPRIHYHFIARALDVGVLGVVAPNVQSPAEARALVDAAKYPPLGKRGFFYGGASSDYKADDAHEFVRYSNDNTSVICMIESPEGLQNLEEIASTPGVDGLWVGHWDLTQFMGIRGQFQDARFLAALKRVVDTAQKHDLATIIQPHNATQLQEWLEIGFNAISYDADFYVYKRALSQDIAKVRKVVKR